MSDIAMAGEGLMRENAMRVFAGRVEDWLELVGRMNTLLSVARLAQW